MSQAGLARVSSGNLPPSVPLQFNGDTGSAVPAANIITIYTNQAAIGSGSTVLFSNSGATSTFSVTDAFENTLIGFEAGNLGVNGTNNTGLGFASLSALTSGLSNTAVGAGSLQSLTTGDSNVAIGYGSGVLITSGDRNTSIGHRSLESADNTLDNTVVGAQSGQEITTGISNTALGSASLQNLTTGSNNIAIGYQAGINLTTSDNNNILIGSQGSGGVSREIILGSVAQNSCYIYGILSTTTSFAQVVTVDTGSRQMGSVTTSNNGVLISSTTGIPSWLANGTTGQVLTATTGSPPSWSTISTGGFTWTDVTSATQTLAAQNGYLTDRGGGVTYTLPASGTIGDTIKIVGKLGLATITPNANQQILIGSSSGTVGITGTCVANNVGDCIELICTTSGASTVWRADSVVGTWTLN